MSSAGSKYDVVETVRRGDDATLERAVRKSDGRRVLLKVFFRALPFDIEQIRNELALAPTLDLPRVARPLELDELNGLPAIVREDVDGVPLDRMIGAPMSMDAFLTISAHAARAVEQLHRRSVVHRLLKPESLFVNAATGEVWITDFGIAFRLPRVPSPAFVPRLVEGVLSHMSPEQTGRVNRVTDTRSDLYSLGVTFYQMLVGSLPFSAADPLEWTHCHIARAPIPPAQVVSSIPETVSAIVMRLLAKSAEERYQTAAGLRHDLERCLTEWRARGKIAPFELQEWDVPERFLVPQKLYGREDSLAALFTYFERVLDKGAPAWVLVAGPPGVGKSSLVQKVREHIIGLHGFFASGKFDRYKSDVPYSTIARAGRELLLQVLAEGAERVALWKEMFDKALGLNARLLVDLIPELELIIGPQSRVPELPLSEAENRVQSIFAQFLRTFTEGGRPVALFFDDLQWVDSASLKILTRLATLPEQGRLLVMGAYRDDEVPPSHPLAVAAREAREGGADVEQIVLEPLSVRHIGQLVASVVHRSPAEVTALAELVHEKTAGNPFFAIQFLADLQAKNLLRFAPEDAEWRWDTAKIRKQGYTDNVIELMVAKLERLTPAVRELVAMASCLGMEADTRTLALLTGKSEADVHRELSVVVDEGLLGRQNGSYRFPHDRVQEAAYALTPLECRADRHLRIGRLLLSHATAEEQKERIFDIAIHLNRGKARLENHAERLAAAEINRLAGERAMASAAFASAAVFFAAGIELVGADALEQQYSLAFPLYLQQARCELSSGGIETADRLLATLWERARTRHDKTSVCLLRVTWNVLHGEMIGAVKVALETCAELFDIHLPARPSTRQVGRAIDEVWALLDGHDIEKLVDLPLMTDPDMRDASDILSAVFPAVYYAGEANLYDLIVCHLAKITLEHGNSDAGDVAPVVYVKLGEIAMRRGMPEQACRFARVAEALVERYELVAAKARIHFLMTGFIHSWVRHPRDTMADFERACALAVEVGDLSHETISRGQAALCAFASGAPLSEVAAAAARGTDLTQRVRFQPLLLGVAEAVAWLVDTLGGSAEPTEIGLATSPIGRFYRGLYEMIGSLILGEAAKAARLALEIRDLVLLVRDLPPSSEYAYYAGLAVAGHWNQAPPSEQAMLRDLLAEQVAKVRRWMAANPAGQHARHSLLGAELARIDGRPDDAVRLFEDAIQSAEDQDLVHERALACEIAARFYRARGRARVADAHLGDARSSYARWGADAKVAELDRRYPHLARRMLAGTGDSAASIEHIDLLSILKASQSVSREIVLENLVFALMRILLQEGGAERGYLLLVRDGALSLVAEATSDGNVRLPPPSEAGALVPLPIVEAARRSGEPIVLDDHGADGGIAPALGSVSARRPRSLLCLPILRQSEAIGVLYLENSLIAAAFTPDRIAVLEILAAQAAISLQNAELLEQEQAARMRAEGAERRAGLLAEAGRELNESLEYEPTLRRLAHMTARRLADWCIIDILENGDVRRVAGETADPADQRLLDEVLRRYPPRLGSPAPAAHVLATGESLLMADVTEPGIRDLCVDDEHARLMRNLGSRSGLAVPLVARGKTLGSITFGSAEAKRYGQADLELAQELARRAAIAIDNALLYRSSQEAVALRDEFLSVASHELRTPIHSLQLIVQGLTRGVVSPSPEHVARAFGVAERQVGRLTRLIDELLEVSRIQAGRLAFQLEKVDLGALVGEVVAQFDVELARSRCALNVRADPAVVGMWDRSKLEQVVANLLSNAIKFGAGKPIEIRVEKPSPDTARIVVADHGIGIPPERLPRVFERFERAVSAREYGGLGLGLYIVRSVVQGLGGTVEVASEPGVGSVFTVTLAGATRTPELERGRPASVVPRTAA
jgi:predicted ATPase/signal transduction histidine kinase